MTRPAWTVLGAGSALPRAGYGPSGHLLQYPALGGATLCDCGPGTIRSLAAAGVELADLRRVILTHFHVDHCLDLAALAFARRNPAARAGPLTIYATAGITRVLDGLEHAFGRSATWQHTEVITLDPARGQSGVDLGGARLRWATNGHTADSISIAIECSDGCKLAYTGDTGPCEPVAQLALDADLLVCECSFPDDSPVNGHLTPRTAGQLAQRARARRLLLTHFYPMLDPARARAAATEHFDGPVEMARDGSRHRL